MTENLRLGDPTKEITLTPADSNVAENFVLPVGEDWATGGHKWGNGDNTSQDETLVDEKHVYVKDKETYGAIYNYFTAVAGTSTYSETANTDYSVCPKGFILPSQNNYYSLLSAYSITAQNTTSDRAVFNDAIMEFPLDYVYSGHYWCGGSIPRRGEPDSHAGGWWTSTLYNGSTTTWHKVKGFYLENYNRIILAANWGLPKQDGFAIRCIAQ